MKLVRPTPDDVAAALLLPTPRQGRHDAVDSGAAVERVSRRLRRPAAQVRTALPNDVELQLASLAGVDALPQTTEAEPAPMPDLDVDVDLAGPDFSRQLLRVSQYVAVGALVLIVVAAVLSAHFGGGALRVAPAAFAAWGLGASVCAMTLAAMSGDPTGRSGSSARHTVTNAALYLALVTCVSGVVANAGGVASPAWVLFLPVVLVCGAVVGPIRGLAAGGLAAAGLYVAAVVSHTLTVAGIGHLVVLLPTCPAAGWAAGALGRLAHQAAAEAAERRSALERDVLQLAAVLETVAAGDLTRVPAPGEAADPVATALAVVFADTLLALRRLVRQMHSVTDQLVTSAADLTTTADDHVGAVAAQTAAVAETTTTVEQLAATAGSIAEIAERVSRFAGTTRHDVDAGVQAVHAAGAAMETIAGRVHDLSRRSAGLQERITRVGAATKLIDDLARRTAILSVNASVEAARVGDHGHGFSTVATEVTTLAARAREATRQIGDILAQLERQAAATAVASDEGLVAVEAGAQRQAEVVASLHRITRMVDRTTAAAREITAATRQQRFASDAVVAAMETVTTSGERYRNGSVGHAAAARRMNDLGEALKDTLGRFKVG